MSGRVIVTEHELQQATYPRGNALRSLRESHGKTQLWVEAEADLGTGYLQRLESGRVLQPGRTTLERILAAVAARYSERRHVMELFGYTVSTPEPDDEDRAWAKITADPEIGEQLFPTYVLDATVRLVTWNSYLPKLLGVRADEQLPGSLVRKPMLIAWLDEKSPLGSMVTEPERLYPAMLNALRLELQRYPNEAWIDRLVRELCADSVRFREIWNVIQPLPSPAGSARARVPITLNHPTAGLLAFRLAAEPFARDTRFRTISLFPADPTTMTWCAIQT